MRIAQQRSMDDTAPIHTSLENQRGSGIYTRVVAALVLLPTIPMLFLSIVTLALFYLAPTRFSDLLSRLPGESFIRSALVFAPATLFAIVVLAVLYVLDRPTEKIATKVKTVERSEEVRERRVLPVGRVAGLLALLVAGPMLIVTAAMWLLSFVSPVRFAALIEPLPGDAYLQKALPYAPLFFFIVVITAVFFVFASRVQKRGERVEGEARTDGFIARWSLNAGKFTNMAVGLVLITALPALLAALGAFSLYHYSPDRFARILERLPYDEFVRLGLGFAPVTLLAVVLLAMIFLARPQLHLAPISSAGQNDGSGGSGSAGIRSTLALWVLLGGLSLSAVIVVGLMGAVLYILVR